VAARSRRLPITGEGAIVADYFDAGCSGAVVTTSTGGALRALTADAIVVGKYERAFSGNQIALAPLLDAHGIRLWLPEAFGFVDMNEPAHRALMMMLGAQSRREVLYARHRVLAAMRIQACEQGRYLDGRPPYEYRLMDAGPHPNQANAQRGGAPVLPDPVRPVCEVEFTEAARSLVARDLCGRLRYGASGPKIPPDSPRTLGRGARGWLHVAPSADVCRLAGM
jgi:hypothetical protein